MSSYLPNTSYYYDPSTAKEMDLFLNHIYLIAKCNPNIIVGRKIIYNELKKYYLKKTNVDDFGFGKSIEEYFELWGKRFAERKNIFAYRDDEYYPYFFQFVNPIKNDTGEYIKLSIPMDYEHIYMAANEIFDFLAESGIEHESMIPKQMSSSSIIIRLQAEDFDNANKIIAFISGNSKIRNGLNKVNPFIPTRRGIGISSDHGNSYSNDLANYIGSFINDSLKNYFKTEIMAGDNKINCEECNTKRICYKQLKIKNLPNILVISLKRFDYDYKTQKKFKLNNYFEFPFELNMSELTGITIHFGVSDYGHYYDLIKASNNKWYMFNDTNIKEFPESDIPKEAFGEKKNNFDLDGEMSNKAEAKEQDKKNAYICKQLETNII